MPSGRTHDRITWLCSAPVLYGAWHVAAQWPPALCAGGAFVFAGLMFSGDLDLPSVQYQRWGPLRWIWKPYQWCVPHRSRLSHGILVGPAVRLLYLSVVLLVLGAGAYWGLHALGRAPSEAVLTREARLAVAVGRRDQLALLYALAGLWLGGASHTAADVSVSWWKRRRRRAR
ncbi:MAG TPA: metal-binding protein [Oscillatoriaceae cyanobacterium]